MSRKDELNPNFKYRISKYFLVKEYVIGKKSIEQIAYQIGCSIGPIRRNLKKYRIKARRLSVACRLGKTGKYVRTEFHRKIQSIGTTKRFINNPLERDKYRFNSSGSKNPNWHGGKYHEEYGRGFGSLLKEEIRCRDKYKCVFCGLEQVKNGRQLDCHHIDYNKRNHNRFNLVSLCRKCHMKTSYKRNRWIRIFKEYINRLEGGDKY